MKTKRKIIEIDEDLCNGCGECVTACAEGAIEIVDGKARVVKDSFCDGLGACLNECPMDALKIVEREADAFDEKAVERHLAEKEKKPLPTAPAACGCPSAGLRSFQPRQKSADIQTSAVDQKRESALSNWPIQIHLVPPTAPFLKNADLLVTADCVPAACPNFHADFLGGKALLLGCPKLDQADLYVDKFAAILQQADIRSITVLIMEVPCCSGLPAILRQAMEKSGVWVPLEEIIISIQEGEVIRKMESGTAPSSCRISMTARQSISDH